MLDSIYIIKGNICMGALQTVQPATWVIIYAHNLSWK